MSDELNPTDLLADEELLQPSDYEGGIPPTYSAGSLPPGEPVIATPRAKSRFYGPLSGPFAIKVPGDILQVDENWSGYIRQAPDGGVAPVSEANFKRVYEIVGGYDPAAEDAIIAELQKERDDLKDLVAELQGTIEANELEQTPEPDDGQPSDLQEQEDFAQDGELANHVEDVEISDEAEPADPSAP